MKKKSTGRLRLHRETVRNLSPASMAEALGGTLYPVTNDCTASGCLTGCISQCGIVCQPTAVGCD